MKPVSPASSILVLLLRLCRATQGRQYPDLKWLPHTLTHMGDAAAEAWDRLDTDGDYSWRYDNHNLMGHYGKGAIMRALHPGQPVGMITWMGWWRPGIFHGDEVYTDTPFPEGPWRYRDYVGTRAALACYVSGTEAGFFNERPGLHASCRRNALPQAHRDVVVERRAHFTSDFFCPPFPNGDGAHARLLRTGLHGNPVVCSSGARAAWGFRCITSAGSHGVSDPGYRSGSRPTDH